MSKSYLILLIGILMSTSIRAQDGEAVWDNFISHLRSNRITIDRIKPYDELGDSFKPILLSFLDSLRVQASDDDWEVIPEIIYRDNKNIYIFPWSTRYNKTTYCLTLKMENSEWYFEHLEGITLRLDKYGDLPVSAFPDIDEARKGWMREEINWSYLIINFYIPVSKELGQDYALSLFKDGAGYFVGAKAWVPFLEEKKAFILYMCWEQANLLGNNVTLELLDENMASLTIESQYLALYHITGHLSKKISLKEHKQIFETIWHDRAKYAGWNLIIEYQDEYTARFVFSNKK